MDVLKPQLLWIGKRCYRVNSVANDDNLQQPETNEYIEDDLYGDEEDDAEEDFNVVEISPNRFKTTIHVPQPFFGAIIGAKGAVKKRIEGETRTEITVPKYGASDDIKILGTKPDSVRSARRRIETIVINCRRTRPPTHFTCIQINDPSIKSNFIKFKEEIVNKGPTLGLQEEMFTNPDKLHITIGVTCLMDDIDRSKAVDLLNECREMFVIPTKNAHNGQIQVNVRGIEIMNDDPSSVQILYAKIQSEALQSIADSMLKRFIDAGYAKREFDRDNAKLHMTLINAMHANKNEDDEANNQKFKGRKTFDARHILENYSQYDFGTQQVNEIHLAILRSTGDDGFYRCTSSVQF